MAATIIFFLFLLQRLENTIVLANGTCLDVGGKNILDAIKEGNEIKALSMVDCPGINLDMRDNDGMTPFLLAALNGLEELFINLENRNITYRASNDQGENVLHLAVIGGNANIVNDIIERNEISLNSYDSEGNTIMHIVAEEKPKKNLTFICRILLEDGASASLKNNNYMTPFHVALSKPSNKTEEIIKTILETNKEGFEIKDFNGRTPLQITLDINNKDIFELLLKYNANPYNTDFLGRTILHNAVLKEYGLEYLQSVLMTEAVHRGESKRIINATEGLNIQDAKGYTALHLAAENGIEAMFNILFEQKDVRLETINQNKDTTILSAVKGGKYSILEKLAERLSAEGNYVNKQNHEGTTALHLSVEKNRKEMIELLLNKSADTQIQDMNKMTPIALAASYNPIDIILLFERYNYSRGDMLGLAISNGNDEEVIKYFLEDETLEELAEPYQLEAARGQTDDLVDLNATDFIGRSNFSKIIQIITKDLKEVLIELAEDDEDETASPSITDDNLLNIALFFQGDINTIKLLMNYSMDNEYSLLHSNLTWSPMDIAAFRNKIDVVNLFLQRDKDLLNRRDFKNQTAMHKAAWGGRCGVIEFLHQNMSSSLLNARDMFGRTPLHVAAMRGYAKTVECILQLDKESLNIRDQYEFTPLHLAEIYGHHMFFEALQYTSITVPESVRQGMRFPGIRSRNRNHTATIELLLKKGADPNSQDKTFGWTILHWAAANGDLEVVKMLVENEGNKAKVNIRSYLDQTPLYLARFWGRMNVYEFLKAENAVW